LNTNDPLLRRFDALKMKHGKSVAAFREDEVLISGTYANEIVPDKWADDGLEPTVMPTAYDVIENAVDHILTTPNIRVPMRPVVANRETERQIAENKRYFLQHCWDTFATNEGDVMRRAVKSLIKGKLVLKMEVDWDAIPNPPDTDDMDTKAARAAMRKYSRILEKVSKSKFIFKLAVVPKETVFEDVTQPWDARYVYEGYKITAENALERFGDSTMDSGRTLKDEYGGDDADLDRELEYVEYWSKPKGDYKGEYVCWIDNQRVHDVDNPYTYETPLSTEDTPDYDGFIPYFIADPGWGDVEANCEPEDRYVSMVRPLRSLLRAETRQITEVEAWLRLYMWKPVIGTNLPTVAEGEKDDFALGPGAFWNLNKEAGQEVDVLQFGEAPVTVFQFLGKVQAAADRSSKFGALGGTPQSGVGTATESDSLNRNAATKLSGPITAMRRLITQINACILIIVDKVIETPVTVTGAFNIGPAEITLKPSDINGFYVTAVELDTSDKEMLDARKARLWADLYRIFTGLSERTAMLKAGVDNPTDEQDERSVEDLMKSPQMQQVELLLALSGLGQQGEQVKQAFEMMMQGGDQPVPPGGMPNPGDAGMMTSVDEMGNPGMAARTDARSTFTAGDQAESAYR
jgi:hypothetical protein